MIKRNIYIMYAIALLQGMVFYAPVATLYRTAQGVTISQITIIESISLILCLLFEVPWGWLADRIGYKRTILICNALYFVSKIVFWKAGDFFGFLVERILLAIVCAGLSGTDVSVLYCSADEKNSHRVFSVYNALQTAGLLAASLIHAIWIGANYRMAGFMTVISYGIALLFSCMLVEVKHIGQHQQNMAGLGRSLKRVVTNKSLLLFLIAVAFLQQTHQTITVFLSQLQYGKAGMSTSRISIVYTVMMVFGLLGIFSAKFTRLTGEKRMMYLSFSVAAICCLILAVDKRAWSSIVAVIMLRVTFEVMQPLQTELQNRQVASNERATALSINAIIIDCSGAGISVLFGMIAEKNLSVAFLFGFGLCFIGMFLFHLSGRSGAKVDR